MRTLAWSLVVGGAALLLTGRTAQAAAEPLVAVHVPFAFLVQGQHFPAGTYRIQRIDSGPIMAIRGQQPGASGLFQTTTAEGNDPKGDNAVLVFHRYETTYRLEDVWVSHSSGLELVERSSRTSHPRAAAAAGAVYLLATRLTR